MRADLKDWIMTMIFEKSLSKKRIVWIDSAKGVGVLLIMLSHVGGLPYINNYLFASFIPIFFVLSGYVYSNKINYNDNIKTKRLVIPYVFYSGIYLFSICCYMAIFKIWDKKHLINRIIGIFYSRYMISSGDFRLNVNYMGINSPLWFLASMFTSFILFVPLVNMDKNTRRIIVVIYLLSGFFLSFLPILLPWSIDTSFYHALFILIGYKFSMERTFLNKLLKNQKCMIPFLVFILFGYILLVYINGYINISVRYYGELLYASPILYLIIGFFGSLLFIIICCFTKKWHITKFTTVCGRNSLVLMCTHMFIFKIFDLSGIALILKSAYLVKFIKIIIAIVFAVILSSIYEILARNPKLKWVKYLY